MAEVVITLPYTPRKAFLSLHNRTQRWACVLAHRRCGKTVACINDLIRRALTTSKPDYRGAYVAPFFNQAKAIAWDYLLRFTDPIPGRSLNAAELRVDFPNGARIQLFGADNPDRLRGMFFDDLVADEFGDWKPSVWPYVIRPALADRQGGAIVIGTPKGRNAFYDTWNRAQNDQNWFSLTLPVTDTDVLPASEIEAMRHEMDEDAWRQEMLCDFEAALPGAYYGRQMWVADQERRICAVPYDPILPVHTAWDLGYSDDTAIWSYQVLKNEIHLLECHVSHGQPLEYYAKYLTAKPYKYGYHWLPHDARAKSLASGGRSIQEQLDELLNYKTNIVANLAIEDGIQAARRILPICWFDSKGCQEGLEALRQYQREYDEDKKVFREMPRHDWTSHAADGFRMLAVAWEKEPANAKPKRDMLDKPSLDELWEFHQQPARNGRIA